MAGQPTPGTLLNGPALFCHFIEKKLERLGADDLPELGLVIMQDTDPVHNDIVEYPSLWSCMHQIGYRDVLIGTHDGGVHSGFAAFLAFGAVLDIFLFQEIEDQPGVRILEQVAEGAVNSWRWPPAMLS